MGVEPGTEIPPWRVDPVAVAPMKTMAALLHDPNRIHWDVENVRELGMGEAPINQGPTNVGYIVNMLMAWAGGPVAVQRVRCRFRGNVFAGDAVEAGGVVTAVEAQVDGTALAHCDVWLDRGGDRVVEGTAVVVLRPTS